jgi:hypothetical protein
MQRIIDEVHLPKSGPLEEIRQLTNFNMDSFDPFERKGVKSALEKGSPIKG